MRSLRLDFALVERGFIDSRAKAKAAILSGEVLLNGKEVRKAAQIANENDLIEVQNSNASGYVGRGYRKLEKALNAFDIDVCGLRCMDVGASTGGFTQLLLSQGAVKVYAVDVGTGQLARILCEDERVLNLEKTDFRTLTRELVDEIDFACVDVSFISLKLIFPNLHALLNETGGAVCLIKPQFEAGPERVGKRGIVKDPKVQEDVIEGLLSAARSLGFSVCGLTFSPICGREGNLEFLVYLNKNAAKQVFPGAREVVQSAWRELKC